ncbi:MAG: hypothetical protein ACI319_07650 [Holdemanella porci]
MKKRIYFVSAATFLLASTLCLKSRHYGSPLPIDNLMLQNVMALSEDNENNGYFVISWSKTIKEEETKTEIKRYIITHTTCPSGGTKACVPGSKESVQIIKKYL